MIRGPVYINGKFCAQRLTGVQRYAHGLLQALDRQIGAGVAWTLLLPPGAVAPPLRAIATRTVPWSGPGGLHGWEQWALPRAARDGRLLNLAGSAPARQVRAGAACVMHDAAVFDQPQAYTPVFRLWYRWLFRRLARRARPAITVSRFSQARLAQATGMPPERWRLVPGAADHLADVVPDAGVLGRHGLLDRPFLLAVGSANPTKNLPLLRSAWQALGRRDARLVLVGGRNAQVFAEDTPSSAAGVLELGGVDDASLKALYAAAAGLVFPSAYEGFGLPPLEAMACGCPVLVSDAASLPEVCGDAALVVHLATATAGGAELATADVPILAAAMARLLDEPALREDLRARGRRHAAAFTWDASARALLRALAADEPADGSDGLAAARTRP